MIQTLVAMNEVTKQIIKQNSDLFPIKPLEYGRFLIISIGTGTAKNEEKFNAQMDNCLEGPQLGNHGTQLQTRKWRTHEHP